MKPLATKRWGRAMSATVVAALIATGCGSTTDQADSSTPTSAGPGNTVDSGTGDSVPDSSVLSAAEGAAARVRFAPQQRSAESAAGTLVASDAAVTDCGGPVDPTPEQIAETNAGTNGLIAAFDRYGIAYTSTTDEFGFVSVEYDYNDSVAQAVADSYWNALYPVVPPSQAELDEIIAHNDVIAAQFDAAGIGYTRTTDESGYENLEYDYEDPAAQDAVNAAWLIISPPEPPTAEQLAVQTDDNDKLMAAFDSAGVEYQLVTDELGWAWVEWNWDDQATSDQVTKIFDELYPPIAIDPIETCTFIDGPAIDEPAVEEPVSVTDQESVVTDVAIAIDGVPAEDLGFTPDQIAQRDDDIDAMESGFTAAGVEHAVVGESPWRSVIFDIANDDAVAVIATVLASRS